MKRLKGFTLIELAVVMGIIAVLALIIIAAIQAARTQSVLTQNRGNARTVEVALETYASQNSGKYLAFTGNIGAIKAGGLTTLTNEVSGACSSGGGTIVSTTSTFTITVDTGSCAAGTEKITH